MGPYKGVGKTTSTVYCTTRPVYLDTCTQQHQGTEQGADQKTMVALKDATAKLLSLQAGFKKPAAHRIFMLVVVTLIVYGGTDRVADALQTVQNDNAVILISGLFMHKCKHNAFLGQA